MCGETVAHAAFYGSGGGGGGTTPNFAQTPGATGPLQSVCNVIGLVNNILFWFSTLFWIFAGIFVFYAAFLYLTARGDENQVSKAHHQLIWAVVAIAIALLAGGLPYLVFTFLQGY